MATFQIFPASPDNKNGWVVRITHDNDVVNFSVVYETEAKAQNAADGWADLDEEREKV